MTRIRHYLVLAVDGILVACSLWLAMTLRFDGEITEPYRAQMPAFLMMVVGCRTIASILFRLHRWSFRLSSLTDGARIGLAGIAGTSLFLAAFYLIRHPGPPRSVVLLESLLSTLFMAALRFSPRLAGIYAIDWARSRKDSVLRTLIVGAGSTGEALLRDLQRSSGHAYQVVGFIDNDPAKRSLIVGGRTVLGGVEDLPRIARNHEITQVLLAIPNLQGGKVRQILTLCGDLKLRFKIMPVSFAYLDKRGSLSALQDLSPEDLLPRDPVTFEKSQGARPCRGRAALVTGGGGSIGSEICTQLLRGGVGSLVMVDLNENALYLLKRRLEHQHPEVGIHVEVADIRDEGRMRGLFERYRPQDVFHAAAHKHVPLMESAPCEAIKNNVLGTRNVAAAAHASGAERFVYISTDKAVRPSSVMGASKRIGEEIVRSMSRRSATRFCAVRFGNVLGSAGSVVPLFREQIARGGPVTVTHPEVRRYFMTLPEAVALVLEAAYADRGELYVLDMGEQLRIADLAHHMITMAGLVPDVDVRIEYMGLRPGEKLFEELLTEEEEKTQKVEHRILVAECPAPMPELEVRVQRLVEAALGEQVDRVRESIHGLLATFSQRHSSPPHAASPRIASDAAA
jgi:FlaA1/EpsC-like NDP-sugar epimerase